MLTDADAARCPGPGTQLGGICFGRLPCEAHNVADADEAVAAFGCVYEQREGEVAMHFYATWQPVTGG